MLTDIELNRDLNASWQSWLEDTTNTKESIGILNITIHI
jgi:hypothetical protein